MFEPTDEETAMSPLPCFATRTLVIKSGTEVPAARKVKPITCQCNNDIGMDQQSPTLMNGLAKTYRGGDFHGVSSHCGPPDH